MNELLSKYLKKFKKLRVDRSHGVAPHKPILLISIIQLFQSGQLTSSRIHITPELVSLFKQNWAALVTTNHDCRISYPFFYMKSEGFWKLLAKDGFSNIEKMGSIMKSFSNLNAAVEYAEIENGLFQLFMSKDSSHLLLAFLLDEYFPASKHLLPKNQDTSRKMKGLRDDFLNEPPGEYKAQIKKLIDQNDEEEVYLRGNVFKREIPKIYNNSCCISGLRIDTIQSISIIDACHIVPFSQSYNDTVTNGIALCPNLHRAFDRGLITISSDFEVLVSGDFIEEGNYSIRQFSGSKINLPNDQRFWPTRENLEWHCENVFKND